MIIYLNRLFSNEEETIGILSYKDRILCYTLEDELRAKKIWGETRIPAGNYEIKLRTDGGHHERYKKNFSEHKGMLWIKDVPNFKWILIHIGNDDTDTGGCLLTGTASRISNNRYTLIESTKAYRYIYPIIANPISEGGHCYIKISDEPGGVYDGYKLWDTAKPVDGLNPYLKWMGWYALSVESS